MKLYTRGQVVLGVLITALIMIMLALGLGFIRVPWLEWADAAAASEDAEGDAAAAASSVVPESEAASYRPRESADTVRAIPAADIAGYTQDEKENIDIYERLNGGVVNITTETVALNWFLEPVPQDGGSGSGAIIDTRGYVLTNNHVIENATKVLINLADGTQYEGNVVGTDPDNDIAVVKFSPPKGAELRTIPYGDSASLKVGQKVLAIGNPFGYERTLTVGIVSGLGRPMQVARNHIVKDMIQTDASINPGNSGGPLLDRQGRMIGINTMIASTSGSSAGVGFAIPVNTAKRVVKELIESGKVRRGWIDAEMFQLFPALVRYAELPVNEGLLVSRIRKGSLAQAGGLKDGTEPVRYGSRIIYVGGDVITSVDGTPVARIADLYTALEDNKPGDKVDVEVLRAGKTVKLKLTLSDRDESSGK
ncbi:MAG: trypsin-like peptidase domain-containing protein [Treponema sp.]|jgi:S1-C subfamily serine protease|nr:trypsin-like peptidase domain-containing protein [Treponema sp.]